MKSFKQYISESTVLMDLINKYDDPFSFLAASMDAIANGTLKLKQRGLANARELISAWNKVKKRKIKLKEAIQYMSEHKGVILEASKGFVKGWVHKRGKIVDTTDFDNYHIKLVVNKPRLFGLDEKKILKILEDSAKKMDSPYPEEYVKDQYEQLGLGMVDNDVYIEEYLQKKGWCMFVIDKTHGSISGWDEKSTRQAAKALDDKHLPYETRKDLKLFEVKWVKPFKPKYITSKYEWYEWLEGKKTAGKRTSIGSTMAQFRESHLITELFDKPYPYKERENNLRPTDYGGNIGTQTFEATTKDGDKIGIKFGQFAVKPNKSFPDGLYEISIEFYTKPSGNKRATMGVTDKGDAGRIMATVLAITKKMVEEHDPNRLRFHADKWKNKAAQEPVESGRISLYNALVKRFAKKMGFSAKLPNPKTVERKGEATYSLEKIGSRRGSKTISEAFKQYILMIEAFDKPYRWQLKKDDEIQAKYQAVTDAGDKLRIDFEKWSVGIDNLTFSVGGSVGTTGEGDAFRIMATVLDVVKDYIKNNEPKGIQFTANKDEYFGQDSEKIQSREKLYTKMIERFAKKAGYKVKLDKDKYSTHYKLTKI